MRLSALMALAMASFASHTFGQFDKATTTDPQGKPIYVAAGATSSVAAPAFTPTLVYNCYYMPLICENVADYARDINQGGGGDLSAMQLFYFDPDVSHKESRRRVTCGCFPHDDCQSALSKGKQMDVPVSKIADQALPNSLNTPINAASRQVLLAGSNPGVNPNTDNAAARVPLTTVPGRFFRQGIAFSCDEFPAATFINGGSGAKTICALQSWSVFSGANAPGKWPLASGQLQEQDWQAQSHKVLRQAFGIGGGHGLGTVYPFSFTTITDAIAPTKAYVVKAGPVTKGVIKRNGSPTFTARLATTTVGVLGNEELEPEDRGFEGGPVNHINEKTPSALKPPPNPRFKRQFAATQSSTVSSASSAATTLATSQLNAGTGALPATFGASSTMLRSANSSATTSIASLTSSSVISFSSTFGTGTSSAALVLVSASTATVNSPSNSIGSSTTSSNNSSLISTASPSVVSFSTASAVKTSSAPGASIPATSLGAISTTSSTSKSSSVTSSGPQLTGDIVAGNPAATSSVSVLSSNVASASSAAAVLVADPSNQRKAQAAQQQTNNAKEAASAMLARAVSGSPLANALSSLFGTLGTAVSAANAAVDATTPAAASAAASELVSDLKDAANEAEDVKKESDDDDDEPTNSPSTSPSASETSPSTASRASSTTPSSQSTPSSITSSASSASFSSTSSSTTSSSASAGPSVCTLAFDEDGDEDIEVGDDYKDDTVDLDPTTADDVPCMPIYGPGGSIIPCGASASGTDASSSAASISGAGNIPSSQNPSTITASTTKLISSMEASTIANTTPSTPATFLAPAGKTTETTPSPSPILTSSTPPPPYATGTCSFHLTETQDCSADSSNLYANVTLYDNNKSIIGQTTTGSDSIGEPINVSDPYDFDSKLPHAITITGEHEGDYVQFNYGALSWTSRIKTGSATCSNGGWDPRDGPVCDPDDDGVVKDAVNNMDCSFPC